MAANSSSVPVVHKEEIHTSTLSPHVDSKLTEAAKVEQTKVHHEAAYGSSSKKPRGPNKDEKNALAKGGAVIAAVAAVALGGYFVYKNNKKDLDLDVAEIKAHRAKNDVKHGAQKAGGWFGRKTDEAKDATSNAGHSAHSGLHKAADKASQKADQAVNAVKDAGGRASDKLHQAGDSVKDSARSVRDSTAHAAEKSDSKVRHAADKADHHGHSLAGNVKHAGGSAGHKIEHAAGSAKRKLGDAAHAVKHKAGDTAHYVGEKEGDLVSGIKAWFARRKDEADEAATRGKDQERRMAGQAKHTANKVADKVR